MLSVARRQPFAILLAAQLAGVLVYPAMEGSDVGRALFSVFGIAILGLVRRGAELARPDLGGCTARHSGDRVARDPGRDPGRRAAPYSSAVEAVLYFYGAGALIAYMLEDTRSRATSCLRSVPPSRSWPGRLPYTFTVYQAIEPDSFTAAVNAASDRTWMEPFPELHDPVEHRPQ